MSNWSDIDFTATGRELEIERLLKEIDELNLLLEANPLLQADPPEMLVKHGGPLFHTTVVKHRAPGYVAMHVTCNCFGPEAITELISRFPDLLFTGTIFTDVNCFNPGGWYCVFDVLPETDLTPARGVSFTQYDMPEQRHDVEIEVAAPRRLNE